MKIIIEDAAYGGYGVGRVDGKVIFVDCAIPGDVLEINILEEKKNYSFAEYFKILKSSEIRKESPCPNFQSCGGCSYLNLDYGDELALKKSILKEQLKRIALLDPVPEINIISDKRYHYRSHSSVKCINSSTGFYKRNTNVIIPFPDSGCLLLSKKLTEGLTYFKSNLSGETKIAEDWNGNFFYDNQDNGMVEEKTGRYIYRRNINSFFQSNKFLREKMSDLVCEYSELTKNDEFADICSGCGFFTIPLSKIALSGTGFDIDKKSIENARNNSTLNNCTNLKFFSLSESEINPSKLNVKTVVIDPPRSGISKKGRRTINAINPEIIVYISCNPSTYARDIADFFKNGYELKEITLIDMFPCTFHIEIVSKLVKKS